MTTITHFAKFFPPDLGGIESVTATLARGAQQSGNKVSIVCFSREGGHIQEVMEGVEVQRAPTCLQVASQPLGLRYCFNCLKAGRGSDIVHVHTPNILAALCALFIPKRVSVVVHWHSDIIGKKLLGLVVVPIEKMLLMRATRIVATSHDYAACSHALRGFEDKTDVIPLGVPDPMLNHRGYSLPNYIEKLIEGKKLILSVGRLVPYKGYEVLIDAAKNLDDRSIVLIVGRGPAKSGLNDLIKETGQTEKVKLLGSLDNDSIAALYERADIFCLPSITRAEAFGVVLIEAMSYSVPIVTTKIPGSGVPSVNKHGVSGLNVEVCDGPALAEACNNVLSSTLLSEKLSKNGRLRFEENFTEEAFVNAILDLYAKL